MYLSIRPSMIDVSGVFLPRSCCYPVIHAAIQLSGYLSIWANYSDQFLLVGNSPIPGGEKESRNPTQSALIIQV